MNLAISGTYSTGKTTTTLALSYLTGIPRTHAKTMREILPEALPGKKLEECSPAELFQLGMRRYTERAVHESHLPNGFISDGSSIHEWVYGKVRVNVGINPNEAKGLIKEKSNEMKFFDEVMDNMGAVMKQHAKRSYDEFIHLPVEFPLVEDGHRPVSEFFRKLSDELLIKTLHELGIKYHIVSGTIEERLKQIVDIYNFKTVMDIESAIDLAIIETSKLQTTIES